MITARPQSYLESLAAELQSQSERVRSLIGSAHWLHDGRHKEHLLAEVVAASPSFVSARYDGICDLSKSGHVIQRTRYSRRGLFVGGSHFCTRRTRDFLFQDRSCCCSSEDDIRCKEPL